MKRIFIPTETGSDWQPLLAQPKMHWKKAHSAMTAAACWEDAGNNFPIEVQSILDRSGDESLVGLKLLVAMPEWEVDVTGGTTASQTDIMVLASNKQGLVVVGVEAKVDEPFGPTMGEKGQQPSSGQLERTQALLEALKLEHVDDCVRYQLLHRTYSAIRTAEDFHAGAAVMLVHSFSPSGKWRRDFNVFCQAMGAKQLTPDLYCVERFDSPRLYLAWCTGDKRFLDVELPSKV